LICEMNLLPSNELVNLSDKLVAVE